MGARTSGREAAVQMLFGIEAAGSDADEAIARYWREMAGDAEGRPYADACVRGVLAMRGELDAIITRASQHWRLERMARVDRNVLRLGTWELKCELTTPRAVILDEAVELAKRFGSDESPAFVNGVLDKIADDVGRPNEPR